MDNNTKSKIVDKLNELIKEGESLKTIIKTADDQTVDTWEMKARRLLERIGDDKIVGKFNMAGAFPYNYRMTEGERLQYVLKAIEGRKNFLSVIKEDLEFFDEKDEPELKKIKHKLEAGINLKVFNAKYTQEREKE